ncbi:hypothetical protein HOD38_01035 [archaeon]|jgi:hypothetical protein|nr:hypothetical protein [archaeon]MBT4396828.1 hypothetical protein [archaeon]MBT4441494.1 hypothetical protein [archaeon]
MGLFEKGVNKENNKDKPKVVLKDSSKEVSSKKKYKTDIDRLLKLIQTSKSVDIDDVPDILNLDINQIEDLAAILEKKGLIETHYPPVGSVVLRIKGSAKKEETKKTKSSNKIFKVLTNKKVLLGLLVLIIVIGGIFFIKSLIQNAGSGDVEIEGVADVVEEVEVVEEAFVEEVVELEVAFSGEGSYYCDAMKSGFNTEYWILDTSEKLVTYLGTSDSTVIIKDDNIYTYLESSGIWLSSTVTESTARPGSNVPELDSVECRTYVVEESLFEIEESLIQ